MFGNNLIFSSVLMLTGAHDCYSCSCACDVYFKCSFQNCQNYILSINVSSYPIWRLFGFSISSSDRESMRVGA